MSLRKILGKNYCPAAVTLQLKLAIFINIFLAFSNCVRHTMPSDEQKRTAILVALCPRSQTSVFVKFFDSDTSRPAVCRLAKKFKEDKRTFCFNEEAWSEAPTQEDGRFSGTSSTWPTSSRCRTTVCGLSSSYLSKRILS